MTDILQERLKASPDAFASAVGDETVLLQVKRGIYYGLDAMGTRFWAGLNEGRSPAEICEKIAAEYGVAIETVETDARAFLEDLKANEIVTAD
jgi:hypothetical protein